jgi:predicted permease
MEIPVLRGRPFDATDGPDGPLVAVVNDAFARAFFPDQDPIGRRFSGSYATADENVTIVGVVRAIRHDSLTAAPVPEFYVPFEQRSVVANSLLVRADGDPARIAGAITSALWAADPNVPVSDVMTMDALLSRSTVRPRVLLYLLAAFAAVGLALGGIGIYGVVSWTARMRAREIGIRMALGARRASVVALVLRQSLHWTLAGIVIGTVAALIMTRLMRGFVFGVPAADPVTFFLVPVILLAVAGAAGYLPARRASDTDPASTLAER